MVVLLSAHLAGNSFGSTGAWLPLLPFTVTLSVITNAAASFIDL